MFGGGLMCYGPGHCDRHCADCSVARRMQPVASVVVVVVVVAGSL